MSFFSVGGINKIVVLSCLTNALFILGTSNYLFIINGTLTCFICLFVFFFLQNIHLMKTLKFMINQKQVTSNHSTLSQNLKEIRRTPSSFWGYLDKTEENFATNVPKILDLKSSSKQVFSENCRWVPLIFWCSRYSLFDVNTGCMINRGFRASARIHSATQPQKHDIE